LIVVLLLLDELTTLTPCAVLRCAVICCNVIYSQVGGNLALERARFESRLRRLKLSCGRWKADYQKEIMGRYNEMVTVLETRYMR
jgi:hypothetical protein